MKTYKIASIPGDGIGKEVVPAAIRVLREVENIHGGLKFEVSEYPWGSEYYLEHQQMMPEDGLGTLKHFDAIFLGAVGNPDIVPDHISLWELLINIRRSFEQVINIRPARTFAGLSSKLANSEDFDFIVVRENSEGEYSEAGGTIHQGGDKVAIQNAIFSRKGTERAMKFAFELAEQRRNKVTSATKSNGIYHTMPFWDEVFKDVSDNFPEVQTEKEHIDALAASFVTRPERFDVIVASNLFGDILTDIGAAIMGSVGIAPAANINMNGKYPSMFEPVHGSAPDIEGKGMANPIGQIWTAKMMLDHFGETEIADQLLTAIESVIRKGIVTQDIGGKATTTEVTDEIIQQLAEVT
ncbi:tartrate dehydrogenase [Natribacillus halophilus]|uniref:D-malate dehydrogenase (decarboxylating) n=1 Tax=Natribacillus halophilus TaxID=549003 RepID=A0A1G8MK93_9BACI|nr:tartrate dehydrogenase [Natribacillus halophilus]SDI68438.1 tartrate dehydrogenase/decarboxylase / D-malate dehydrogenase [Natribacillus halophilus]